jgi:hypothetical protein
VKLLSVPAAAYVALNLNVDQLLNELQTVAAPDRGNRRPSPIASCG